MTVDDFPVLRKWCRPFSSTAVDQIPVLELSVDEFPMLKKSVDDFPVLKVGEIPVV